MKNMACLLLVLLPVLTVCGQGVFNNQTNTAIQRVIEDFPHRFSNIKGNRLANESGMQQFHSKIQISGSLHPATVNQKIQNGEAFSWTCDLFESASFDEASLQYKKYYDHLKNTIIRLEGRQPFILSAPYQIPVSGKPANNIQFHLLPSIGEVQALKVELALYRQGSDWLIRLSVFNDRSSSIVQN
ncbi:MAG TPA: hypothetical protein VFS31_07260 [Chitinophagaceae bacterium]|nr:hypothetical protein [Chitinophagaceae bacterium]